MEIKKLNDSQVELLEHFDEIGGVLKFVVIEVEEKEGLDINIHRESAAKALEQVKQDNDRYFEDLLLLPEYKNQKRSDFINIQYDSSKLEATEINLKTFMGNYFDLKTNRLLLRGSHKFLNDYFLAGDKETTENIVDPDSEEDENEEEVSEGYAKGFSEPPYRLTGSPEEINKLFLDIGKEFFGSFLKPAKIFNWNTDCSNYFDDGKEWWGTYFYTYYQESSKHIVCVLGSSTD